MVATVLTILLRINWPNLLLQMWEISVTRNFQGYFSRTLNINFQDFPGPGILKKKNPRLSRRRGNPGTHCQCQSVLRRFGHQDTPTHDRNYTLSYKCLDTSVWILWVRRVLGLKCLGYEVASSCTPDMNEISTDMGLLLNQNGASFNLLGLLSWMWQMLSRMGAGNVVGCLQLLEIFCSVIDAPGISKVQLKYANHWTISGDVFKPEELSFDHFFVWLYS